MCGTTGKPKRRWRPAPGTKSLGKTFGFVVLVVLSNTAGNYFLSLGLRNRDAFTASALFTPAVLLGVALLILWTLARMALLSWADLSFVLPVTSIGYVLSALLGKFALGEAVSGPRWLGTLLIVAGTALVATTAKPGASTGASK